MSTFNFSQFTKEMQAMLPQWMRMAKDPSSVGAQFLNVFGLEFDDVKQYLDHIANNMFIETADIGQIDIIYRVPVTLGALITMSDDINITVVKDKTRYLCEVVNTLREFYMAPSHKNIAILDKENSFVYLRLKKEWMEENVFMPVSRVEINDAPHFEYQLHHVWNAFDEFGLLVGLYRFRGERNEEFKERILDVFRNPGNATKQGILNGLSRELGIPKEQIAIHELSDPAFKKTLLNDDGSPTPRLINLAKKINEILGSTWNHMSWDEAYWHSIEEENIGLEYLPHVWDASMDDWRDEDFQSGIGDGLDLKVRAPEKLDNKREFKYYVGLRGKKRGTELVSPEITFKYKILAKGKIQNDTYKPENFRYTIIASEIIKLYYIIRAHKTYYFTTKIDFSGSGISFTYDNQTDPNCEIVTGQDIMSPKADPYLRIEAYLKTYVKSSTPKINRFTVKWEDTEGRFHDLVFDSELDFDRNDAAVTTTKIDISTTSDGAVELGYGDFYHLIHTKEDFSKAKTMENITINKNGSIQLTPFNQE